MANWEETKLYELSRQSLDLLVANKIPAIIVKNFVAKDQCELVAGRLKSMAFGEYGHMADIPCHHIGVCHNQWANDAKSVYFEKAEAAKQVSNDVFAGIMDNPVARLMEILRDVSGQPVGLFEEDGHGPYFAGAFRSFRGHGRLHVDHAPTHITTDWSVKNILAQLSWNIYYSVLNSGGETKIYDTILTNENNALKVPNDYYFPYEVLESDRHLTVVPEVGDLLLFNTRNFHEVMGNEDGRRLSQTSFIGVKRDGSLHLWS